MSKKTETAISRVVNKLRSVSEKIKEDRDPSAEKIVDEIVKMKHTFDYVAKVYKTVGTVVEGTSSVVNLMATKPQLRKQVVGVFSNAAQDVAQRINQISNVVESFGKEDEFHDAAESIISASDEMNEAVAEYVDAMTPQDEDPDLHVVDDDEDENED